MPPRKRSPILISGCPLPPSGHILKDALCREPPQISVEVDICLLHCSVGPSNTLTIVRVSACNMGMPGKDLQKGTGMYVSVCVLWGWCRRGRMRDRQQG